mmetsp:Transcript_118397/g.307597  ORF Transcript_118397/g.307597 Transcript_118397/m.307597 type:complete len:249 (+) Transcript_118397:81-827(+)
MPSIARCRMSSRRAEAHKGNNFQKLGKFRILGQQAACGDGELFQLLQLLVGGAQPQCIAARLVASAKAKQVCLPRVRLQRLHIFLALGKGHVAPQTIGSGVGHFDVGVLGEVLVCSVSDQNAGLVPKHCLPVGALPRCLQVLKIGAGAILEGSFVSSVERLLQGLKLVVGRQSIRGVVLARHDAVVAKFGHTRVKQLPLLGLVQVQEANAANIANQSACRLINPLKQHRRRRRRGGHAERQQHRQQKD